MPAGLSYSFIVRVGIQLNIVNSRREEIGKVQFVKTVEREIL